MRPEPPPTATASGSSPRRPGLALDIARIALELWQGRTTAATFLDPAIGTGSFYSALRQVFPPEAIADACSVEIDPAFADAARRLWAGAGLRVIPGDFTTLSPRPCLSPDPHQPSPRPMSNTTTWSERTRSG